MNYIKKWKSHGRKLLYKNPFLDFYEYTVERPNGKIYPYYCVEKLSACIIIPVHGEFTYVIGQYRFAARSESWEFPGGGVSSKKPKADAIRELREETGITAKKIVPLGNFFINAGYSNQRCFVYSAHALSLGAPQHESLEFLQIKKVSFKEFESMIEKGRVIDSSSISAYYLYLASINKQAS